MFRARGRDFLQVLGAGVAFFLLFGNRDGNISAIFHLMAEGLETRFESCDTNGGWPHIDTTPRLPEVERNTDHANLAARDTGRGGGCGRRHRVLLFPQAVGQTFIVTESFHWLPVFRPDMAARVVLHLLYFRIGGIRLVIFPSRAILAGVMRKSVYLLFYIIADINPCVLVFVIVIVVEKVLGDHVLLQPLLRDLA